MIELKTFPYTAEEQRKEAVRRAAKMSIQGVQPKLSVRLNVSKKIFEVVDVMGTYIVKPQNLLFDQLPENEDLTMKMAQVTGIEVPFHGLIYCEDRSFSFFVKRFDRISKKRKLAVEDFAQLAGKTRETKYSYSMERMIKLLDYCTFPLVERFKLFRITLFNFLVGNEDMHLKNFSIITREDRIELSPAYDLVNSSIVLKNVIEEIALPLNGKKKGLTNRDLIDYFGKERLELTERSIDTILKQLKDAFPEWKRLINKSFLSESMKKDYIEVLNHRRSILQI